jgi:hypothetical protein
VRELIRQRGTLRYQRVGLSTERDTVLALAQTVRIDERPRALVRDPYVLEFMGLPAGLALDRRHRECAGGVLRRPDQAHGRIVTALRIALVTSIMACARADHPDPVRTMTDPPNQAGPAGSDVMIQTQSPMTCDAAKRAIESRRFVGWRGLPGGCTPDATFPWVRCRSRILSLAHGGFASTAASLRRMA